MKLFFSELTDNALFCAYHPAQIINQNSSNIVICGPLGPEYMYSYRAIRLLADQLANNGHNVLRFDWYGHGDSWGNYQDISINSWERNIMTAFQQVVALTNVKNLSMIAVRFGASIAFMSMDKLPQINRLVLWDPILLGSEWLSELRNFQTAFFPKMQLNQEEKYSQLIGYPFSNSCINDIEKLDVLTMKPVSVPNIDLIVPENHTCIDIFKEKYSQCVIQNVKGSNLFSSDSNFEKVIMSNPAIATIIKIFGGNSL